MAFGMSPFPLRFGTRQGGGGGDPTAITPANADAFFASLGLTQAGTGTTWGETGQPATPLYAVDAAKVPLAYSAALGVWGPLANPAGENLALHGADATNAAWSKTNITPTLQTGSLNDAGAANGHSLLTATDANGTCLQAITSGSAERVSKLWLARETGSGTVEITQDNGSTWAAVSLTSNPQPFNIAAATLANPTVGIRIVTSGDAVRLYGTQHQVVAHPLRPFIGPTAGSAVTTGARTLNRTGITPPSTIDLSAAFTIPPDAGSFRRPIFINDGTLGNAFEIFTTGGSGLFLRRTVASDTDGPSLGTPAVGDIVKVDMQWTGSVIRGRMNNGTWQEASFAAIPSLTTLHLNNYFGNVSAELPFWAFRCNLLDGDGGWNHQILDNWA